MLLAIFPVLVLASFDSILPALSVYSNLKPSDLTTLRQTSRYSKYVVDDYHPLIKLKYDIVKTCGEVTALSLFRGRNSGGNNGALHFTNVGCVNHVRMYCKKIKVEPLNVAFSVEMLNLVKSLVQYCPVNLDWNVKDATEFEFFRSSGLLNRIVGLSLKISFTYTANVDVLDFERLQSFKVVADDSSVLEYFNGNKIDRLSIIHSSTSSYFISFEKFNLYSLELPVAHFLDCYSRNNFNFNSITDLTIIFTTSLDKFEIIQLSEILQHSDHLKSLKIIYGNHFLYGFGCFLEVPSSLKSLSLISNIELDDVGIHVNIRELDNYARQIKSMALLEELNTEIPFSFGWRAYYESIPPSVKLLTIDLKATVFHMLYPYPLERLFFKKLVVKNMITTYDFDDILKSLPPSCKNIEFHFVKDSKIYLKQLPDNYDGTNLSNIERFAVYDLWPESNLQVLTKLIQKMENLKELVIYDWNLVKKRWFAPPCRNFGKLFNHLGRNLTKLDVGFSRPSEISKIPLCNEDEKIMKLLKQRQPISVFLY